MIDPPTKRRTTTTGAWLAVLSLLLLLFSTPSVRAAEPATSGPYQWRSVAIGGGGFVTGVLFHPAERGLAYARTDVGGAYRWDAQAQQWTALTDWLGADDWNLMGIDAFAVDPADADALYLAAGTYMHERAGTAAVLRSFNRAARSSVPTCRSSWVVTSWAAPMASGWRWTRTMAACCCWARAMPACGVATIAARTGRRWRRFPTPRWPVPPHAIMLGASRRWGSPLSCSTQPVATPARQHRASTWACPPNRPACMCPKMPAAVGHRWPGNHAACARATWLAVAMGTGI